MSASKHSLFTLLQFLAVTVGLAVFFAMISSWLLSDEKAEKDTLMFVPLAPERSTSDLARYGAISDASRDHVVSK